MNQSVYPSAVTVCKTDAAWSKLSMQAGLAWTFSNLNSIPPITKSNTQSFDSSPFMAEALAMRLALIKGAILGISILKVFSANQTLMGVIFKYLQIVNHEACRVVETMWTQDAELTWDKLEEQVYTVEKRQEINLGSKAGHLSYWCDPEGEDVHDFSMQKTIMWKDGRYGHWNVRMKLLVRGINEAAWIAVKTGLVCNQAGGEEHGDGHPEVVGAFLMGEKNISIVEDEDIATLVG
ncbi:hypothetical protein IGI04_029604 [Brassica rapa subsp. trilocularis]|uniref:RNase H type-1 domain-containing protein n=1 Tax=Brassica rapa subsp. trilocularis TaxID=1813537 RepID=A0ABQ7LR39_BRACM|nr:hypothetical protein IGI04_029604 [Brassica rapa subsp. trilocularis]